jgi:zinc protease
MTRAAVVLLAVIAAACAAPAAAQTVTRETSPGGLPFRHVQMREATSQALTFAWRDGNAVALPGKEALPRLGAALMLEGPRGMSRSAMFEEFRDYQASASLSAGINVTQGHLTAPFAKFGQAGTLFARVFADPALPPERLAEFVRNWADSSRQSESNAETAAARLFSRIMIADGPHRRYFVNDPALYAQITLADIEAWRRNVLTRAGLILVAAGPMDAVTIGREIDRLFASLPASGPERREEAKPTLRSPGKLVVLERPVVQSALVAGGPAAVSIGPDSLRGQLAISVLGGGASSRLWKAVREKLGAAYGISAGLSAVDRDTRLLAIRTVVANDKAKAALSAIREEYDRFLVEGLTDAELDPRRTLYLTGHHERVRQAPSVAASLLAGALYDYPDDYLATYEGRLRVYTRAEIETDMRIALPKAPLTAVLVAPSAEGIGADCVIKSPEEIARCE